jgi:hypothetical protein
VSQEKQLLEEQNRWLNSQVEEKVSRDTSLRCVCATVALTIVVVSMQTSLLLEARQHLSADRLDLEVTEHCRRYARGLCAPSHVVCRAQSKLNHKTEELKRSLAEAASLTSQVESLVRSAAVTLPFLP